MGNRQLVESEQCRHHAILKQVNVFEKKRKKSRKMCQRKYQLRPQSVVSFLFYIQ